MVEFSRHYCDALNWLSTSLHAGDNDAAFVARHCTMRPPPGATPGDRQQDAGPTFFVVVRRFENWLKERKRKTPEPEMAPAATRAGPDV